MRTLGSDCEELLLGILVSDRDGLVLLLGLLDRRRCSTEEQVLLLGLRLGLLNQYGRGTIPSHILHWEIHESQVSTQPIAKAGKIYSGALLNM